jgi:hypothetical protein
MSRFSSASYTKLLPSTVAHTHLFTYDFTFVASCACPQMGSAGVHCPKAACFCTEFLIEVTLTFSTRGSEGLSFLTI